MEGREEERFCHTLLQTLHQNIDLYVVFTVSLVLGPARIVETLDDAEAEHVEGEVGQILEGVHHRPDQVVINLPKQCEHKTRPMCPWPVRMPSTCIWLRM